MTPSTLRKTLIFTATIFCLFAASTASAENKHWTNDEKIKVFKDKKGDCKAEGHLKYNYAEQAGKDFFVVEVRMRVKVKGRGHSGRGHAVFTAYDSDSNPIWQVKQSKYGSTGTSKQITHDRNAEKNFLEDKFWDNFAYYTFIVYAEEKDGDLPPDDISKFDDWVKSRAKAVLEASKSWRDLAEGAKKEGGNWELSRAVKPKQ